MKMATAKSVRGAALLTVLLLLVSTRNASAQLKGHYIPGFTGLENGSQPSPSITLAMPVYVYPTNTIKNDEGDSLAAHPSITASFFGLGLLWVSNLQVLGANLGAQITPVAFMKSRIESASLEMPGAFAFTDIYVQPLWLGWHTPRADYTLGWGFFAPTGKWELGGDDNSGLGMWSNDFQAGTTVHLDDAHAWTTSLLATYEIHSHKKDTDLQVGDILTVEGGTGRAFYTAVEGTPIPQIVTVGVVYYGQFKLTADTGTGPLSSQLLAGRKDRVFGVGVEGSIFLPKPRLLVDLRVVPEFGARNRTQGLTFLLSLAWQARSLEKAPAHP
jgi:hypothetical protein